MHYKNVLVVGQKNYRKLQIGMIGVLLYYLVMAQVQLSWDLFQKEEEFYPLNLGADGTGGKHLISRRVYYYEWS